MLGRLFTFSLSIIGITLIMFGSSNAQSSDADLREKRVTIKQTNKPLFDALLRLIYDYDMAIGLEYSTLDSEHNDYCFVTNIRFNESTTVVVNGQKTGLPGMRPVITNHLLTLDYKDARLEDVMNSVVAQMKNYGWEINDGIINIFPIRGRDPDVQQLLKLSIKEFAVPKGTEVGRIDAFIAFGLTEFIDFVNDRDITRHLLTSAPWFADRPLPVDMSFSDLSLRDLLNAVTKVKRGGWILKTYHQKSDGKDKKYINLTM